MADVFLKIEDEILSVPRASLAIAQVFEDMFQAPQPPSPEGSTRDNPIVLEGEKIAEWRTLIKVLIPLSTGGNMPTNLSIYDWHDSLKLATKYNIEPVRKRAIEAIDGEDRYWYRHKIEWGLEYHVKSFIVDGSTAAVNALLDSTLNLGLSMSELGGASRLQTVVKLFWIEKALRSPDSVYHPSSPNPSPSDWANPISIRIKYSSVKCRKGTCGAPMYPDNLACLTCGHRHGEEETLAVTDWDRDWTGLRARLATIICSQCSKSIYSKNWAAYYQCTTCKEKFHINQHFPVTRVYDINELIEEAFEEEIKLCY
ncbi:hypothetical protein D9611_015147 [Ephemerocybe angulata]|uniref:Uncharacterized protein n=1 Tax=Ephemerocybe angulata TaxID=980116 RepID=A0A8H5B715_9AGAR|nr:hypothetical protein D9611_015147 [Tulosesus angulatus]